MCCGAGWLPGLPAVFVASLFAVILLVGLVPTASAGTAEVSSTGRLTYTDGLGEENTVTLTRSDTGWTITDTTADIAVGSGCSSVDLHTANCSGVSQRPRILAGELDDIVTNQSSADASLLGGPDADKLYAGSNGDSLSGDEGADLLQGSEGTDALFGGDGDDELNGGGGNDMFDGGLGADTLYGGAGAFDRASYYFRSLPVNLTLDGARNDGEEGELDYIASDIEELEGGAGNDSITGNAASNFLTGWRATMFST